MLRKLDKKDIYCPTCGQNLRDGAYYHGSGPEDHAAILHCLRVAATYLENERKKVQAAQNVFGAIEKLRQMLT